MKRKNFIVALLLITTVSASGCVRSAGSNSETSVTGTEAVTEIATEPETSVMSMEIETEFGTSEFDVYTADWYMEMYPGEFKDCTEEYILGRFKTYEWVRTQEELKEYIHDASEYWDEDGNFTNPASTAYDEGWICSYGPYMSEVADASVPQEVLDELDTAQLLDIANNEKAVVIGLTNGGTSQMRIATYMAAVADSSTYSAFLERPDYAEVLYDYYIGIEPAEYIGDDLRVFTDSVSYKKISTIAFNEMRIVTDKFFDALNDEQRRNVIDKKNEIARYIKEIDYDGKFQSLSSVMWHGGESSVFDAMIKTGISPKWTAFVLQED